MNCSIPVKVGDLLNADASPTKYFWELWGAAYTSNKKWMRQFGLNPVKTDGRWTVAGKVVAA